MNEEELIREVKNHNDEAFEELLNNYIKMIQHIISLDNRYSTTYELLREDLVQEGTIALYQACLKYDFTSKAKFSTFAYLIINRRIKRRIHEHIKRSSIETYSIDSVEEVDYLKCYSDPRANYDRVDFLDKQEKIMRFRATLSPLEIRLLTLKEKGASYIEIAKLTNISRKQVDNKLHYIKIKYKDYMKKD